MKLITAVLIAIIIQISATAVAQQITFKKRNVTLAITFKEVRKQTGYSVIWSSGLLNQSITIDANFHKTPLRTVIEKCLEGMPLTYEIFKKSIIIRPHLSAFGGQWEAVVKDAALLMNLIIRVKGFKDVSGKVVDEKNNPLSGASIKLVGTTRGVVTDIDGNFTFRDIPGKSVLLISYIGFGDKQVDINNNEYLKISMSPVAANLDSVVIYATGYQNISPERATGAFTHLDEKLIDRSVGINILERMEGVTSGLLLNHNLQNGANNTTISIRGRSTIFGNAEPLIVLDGIPYPGNMNEINAEDIKSIDVLKDAAAASIWGTRAGNGVVVITTKKGRRNQKLTIGLVSTLTITGKPDLYYLPQMSPAAYVDLEQYLFSKGYYDDALSTDYSAITPAVDIFDKLNNNEITAADATARLNLLKLHDVRTDLDRYAYRNAVQQQYQLSLSGGGEHNQYYLSGGYNKNLENTVANNFDRLTLNASNTFSLLKDKLEISSDVNFVSSHSDSKYTPYTPFTPYDRLADDQGNSLPVANSLRLSYIDTAGNGKLLDWHYRPKDELKGDVPSTLIQYRIKTGLNYKILNGLSFSANYQYLKENTNVRRMFDVDSYYTRNLINTYSSIADGMVTRVVPMGDILNEDLGDLNSKTVRAQLNYNQKFKKNHELTVLAGYEGADERYNKITQVFYGYNKETLVNENNTINPLATYPYYYSPFLSGSISTAPGTLGSINITQSFYGNFSYSYKKRYILSGSARKDESNLFGIKSRRAVPLWSAGLAWIVNQENGYHLSWLPSLKIRATYGYNGNIDKTVSGFLTVQNYGAINPFGSIYSMIINPPNPSLRWEQVKTWNIGLDYQFKNNRIGGSLDIYDKKAIDLIGNMPIAMQSGVSQFRGNGATVNTKGFDLVVNTRNLVGGFKWGTTFLLNYNTDKVTKYDIKQTNNLEIVQNNYRNPLVGFPYYAVFSFPSAGLDSLGQPRGFLNKEVSDNYTAILTSLDPAQVKYHGSATPKYFGSMINTFSYKKLELSLNITYKLNYFFRRYKVFSGNSYDFQALNYDQRWQKPGDEAFTKIPALSYSTTFSYAFFSNSEDLVERGDHIRLQDIKLSYNLAVDAHSNSYFKNVNIFLYSRNLGILWRKNKWNIDPDYGTSSIPLPLSCSLGVSLTL